MDTVFNCFINSAGLILIFFVYFMPWIIARASRLANTTSIGLLNLFLGWTLIGWVIALIWSTSKTAERDCKP